MGSSSKDYAGNRPEIPPPSGVLNPTPQPMPTPPPGALPPNFLPGDPTQMATGLTAQMFQPQPSAAPPPAAGATAASAAMPGGASQGTEQYVPPEVKAAGPDAVQSYLAAKASGNDALAARIQLSAIRMGGNQGGPMPGMGNNPGYTTSGGGMRSSAGGVPSGAGPGLY